MDITLRFIVVVVLALHCALTMVAGHREPTKPDEEMQTLHRPKSERRIKMVSTT